MPNDAPIEYRGRPIRKVTVAVTNAGDGLSKALKVDPRNIEPGQDIYVVLRTHLAKDAFVFVTGTDGQEGSEVDLVYTLSAGDATIVDGDLVRDLVDQQAERVKLAEEAEKGIQRLPDGSSLTKEQQLGLRGDHALGLHAEGLVTGCALCEEEKAAEDAERDGSA